MNDHPQKNIDGITSAGSPSGDFRASVATPSAGGILARAKFALLTLVGIPYGLFVLWFLFLLSVLPDESGRWNVLVAVGNLSAVVFGLALSGIAVVAFFRIGKSGESLGALRMMGFVRTGIFVAPGLFLSAIVPFWISQEPPLRLTIVSPPAGTELVAPVSLSFSAEQAAHVLLRRGLSVKLFSWDFNADGKTDDETVVPSATAFFDRQGGYTVKTILTLSDGSTRTFPTRIVIPKAVFSYSPFTPVVDEPVKFSVAHLIPEGKDIEVRDVQWDFNEDGVPDETTKALETSYTFLSTGDHRVSVIVSYLNQTQNSYVRTLQIQVPQPNPFPVAIETTPEFLESPPPFQVVFRMTSGEPLQDVKWDFDDGSPEESGERVGHTFKTRRVFQVKATGRNAIGQISKVSTVVKVVENLAIPDLFFDGSHMIVNDRISAAAPVAITLTPKTTMPLVDFWWEAPKATQITSTDTTLNAVYRDQGSYNLILLAKDPEGRVMRKSIVLEVLPKSTIVDFEVRPIQPIAPQIVTFDASASTIPGDEITGFIWHFGEGGPDAKRIGDAREEHRYTKSGTYTVTLTVSTLSGRTETKTKTITVRAAELKACFTMSRREVNVFSGVLFDWNCTSGKPTSVLWNFGDGAQAESNPDDIARGIDHVFERPGEFTVELQIQGENNTASSYTQRVTVQ